MFRVFSLISASYTLRRGPGRRRMAFFRANREIRSEHCRSIDLHYVTRAVHSWPWCLQQCIVLHRIPSNLGHGEREWTRSVKRYRSTISIAVRHRGISGSREPWFRPWDSYEAWVIERFGATVRRSRFRFVYRYRLAPLCYRG